MANPTFRYYTDDPDPAGRFLWENWRPDLVRFQGTRIGRSAIWLVVVVVNTAEAGAAFEGWLDRHATVTDVVVDERDERLPPSNLFGVRYAQHRKATS